MCQSNRETIRARYDYHFRISSIDEVVSGIAEKMSFAIDDKEASVISLTYSSNVPQKPKIYYDTH